MANTKISAGRRLALIGCYDDQKPPALVAGKTKDMIGDLILWIKRVWKQQTCIHTYKWVNRKDNGDSFEDCSKCDKIR